MAKATAVKKVWTPDRCEVNIGQGEYIIEPQPIEKIIEFDKVVKQLSGSLDDFSNKYYVTNGTGKDAVKEPFESEDEAHAYITDQFPDIEDLTEYFEENKEKRLGIRVESVTMKEVLEALVATPYPALKVLIPDLKETDVKGASLPNLKFVFDILIEVNGVAWFERFVKNSLAPVLPDIMNMLVEGIKGALESSTSTNNETNGETA